MHAKCTRRAVGVTMKVEDPAVTLLQSEIERLEGVIEFYAERRRYEPEENALAKMRSDIDHYRRAIEVLTKDEQ